MIRLIPQPYFTADEPNVYVKADNFTVQRRIVSDVMGMESYHLYISETEIVIEAESERGFFYAEKTLEQLKELNNGFLPVCTVVDSPRFEYRGFMIDCARHFFPVYELKRMIDTAASLKLNKFHWHLADDQGFRIELKSYPELTKLGSVRKGERFGKYIQSDKPYGGYYTQEEITRIVEYCRDRFIDVIPELDIPGHSSAILHVFPTLGCFGKNVEVKMSNGIFKDVLCVGEAETVEVIKNIVSELCELFPGEYFHIGGDEVPRDNWKSCPKCQALVKELGINSLDELQQYFVNTIASFLREKGKKVIGWNESLKGGRLNDDIITERWLDRSKLAITAANNGRKIITAPMNPYYVDYPHAFYSLKNVYAFEPFSEKELTDEGRNNILGVESPVWTEFITTCPDLEAHCFPRWFAVAETAWSVPENKNYSRFEAVATKLCNTLHSKGINCLLPSEWNPSLIQRIKISSHFAKNYTTTGK